MLRRRAHDDAIYVAGPLDRAPRADEVNLAGHVVADGVTCTEAIEFRMRAEGPILRGTVEADAGTTHMDGVLLLATVGDQEGAAADHLGGVNAVVPQAEFVRR